MKSYEDELLLNWKKEVEERLPDLLKLPVLQMSTEKPSDTGKSIS